MQPNKPLCVLPVETKVRELDAKLLLSLAVLNQGMEVIIGGISEIKYLVDVLDRGVYLDKSIVTPKKKWFEKFRLDGFKVAALDEEGLVTFDAETYRQLRIDAGSMGLVDCFFAWGDDQVEMMKPAIGSLVDRIRITGNPRFDLLTNQFRPFFAEARQAINEQFGKIILINTNFSFGNSSNSIEGLRGTISQYPIAQKQPDFFDTWVAEQKQIMASMVEVLPKLHERYPDHSIVVRPHPSENVATWQKLCEAMERVHTIREGPVVPWIMASDVLIHWNCTTAIESYLLGVPPIAYRKSCSGTHVQPLPTAVSFQVFDETELFDRVDLAIRNALVDDPAERTKKQDILKRYVASVGDGELAAEKIAEQLYRVGSTLQRRRPPHQAGIRLLKRLWRAYLDRTVQDRSLRDSYAASKFPDTDVEEIQSIVDRLRSCLDYPSSVRAERVWTNCFRLQLVEH